jgi:predicted lipoprotein with Yx(FWY)xxD motif
VRTRRWSVALAAGAVAGLVLAGCTIETEGDDPADMDQVETFPGDQNGDPDDAEGRVVPDEDDEGFDEDLDAEPSPADADEREAVEDLDAPEDANLAIRTTDAGTYLVDGAGWPVYVNAEDESPPVTCVGECLANWPIVSIASEPVLGDSVDPERVTSLEREDGTLQLVYNGYPLHHYAHDTDPDALAGQGVDDVWSVISPDGELLLELGDEG